MTAIAAGASRWMPPLTPSAERRALVVLLANQTFLHFAFFMLFPLISVHFTQNVGLSAAVVGLVLAIRQLSQQGPMFFGGALADRLGYKPAIAYGLLIRAAGFLLIAFATDVPLLTIGCIVLGLGGALGESTALAALAAISAPAARPGRFMLAATAGGIGAATGPLLGVALLTQNFAYVSLVAAACCFAGFILTLIFCPPIDAPGTEKPTLRMTIRIVGRDRVFLAYTALMTGYWFLFSQLFITVPLQAALVGGPGALSAIYAINSIILVAFGYATIRFLSRRFPTVRILQMGLVLMGVGLGSFAFGGTVMLFAGIVIYAVGRLFADPTQQTVTAQLADESVRAAYFGFGMLGLAVGGSTGQFIGGWLFDVGQSIQLPALPWIVCAVVGLSVAGGLVVFGAAVGKQRLAEAV